MEGVLRVLIHLRSSIWASCTALFRGIPPSVILLSWLAICNLKGLNNFLRDFDLGFKSYSTFF